MANGLAGFSRARELPGNRFSDASGFVLGGDTDGVLRGADRIGGGIHFETDGDDNDEAWFTWGNGEKFSFRAGTRLIWHGEVDYTEANTNDKNFFLGFADRLLFTADGFTDSDVIVGTFDGFGFVKHKDDLLLDVIYSDGAVQTLTTNVFSGGLAVSTTYRWGIVADCKSNGNGDIAFYWGLSSTNAGNFFEKATPVATFTDKDLDALGLMQAGCFMKNGAGNAETLVFGGYTPRMIG
jgi:hypothetical protein